MNLYEFALPHCSNALSVDYEPARDQWERAALDFAGSYTRMGTSNGCWRAGAGKIYVETMHSYRVACTPEDKDQLLARAFELFPDQLAFFVAQIGTAEIVERAQVAA